MTEGPTRDASGPAERDRDGPRPPGPLFRWGSRLVCASIDFAFLVLSPFLFIVWAILSRGFTRPKLRRGLVEKMVGFPRREPGRPVLWVHAVSVGEVLAAEPIVLELGRRFPGAEVVVSVATFTGREVAERRLPDHRVFYAPLDASPFVGLALRRLDPRALILVELEVWPVLILTTRRRGVPVLVVNGRMTERSARRYARLGGLAHSLFRAVTAWAVQNEEYAERIRSLGVPSDRVEVLGNVKHDRPPGVSPGAGDELRRRLGWLSGREVVLVAGSTHPGEESLLCGLLPKLRAVEPRVRLVLVPRHVERLVAGEIERWGVPEPAVRWSRIRESGEEIGLRTLVVDTVGELERFYAASDLVVVGGTFIPHGGQNVLEPARLGKATVFGPHHANFRDEVRWLLRGDAARLVAGRDDLARTLEELVAHDDVRSALGARAREASERLRGALERHGEWLEKHITLLGLPEIG